MLRLYWGFLEGLVTFFIFCSVSVSRPNYPAVGLIRKLDSCLKKILLSSNLLFLMTRKVSINDLLFIIVSKQVYP